MAGVCVGGVIAISVCLCSLFFPVPSSNWSGLGLGWGGKRAKAEAEALPGLDFEVKAEVKKSWGLVFWSGDRRKG